MFEFIIVVVLVALAFWYFRRDKSSEGSKTDFHIPAAPSDEQRMARAEPASPQDLREMYDNAMALWDSGDPEDKRIAAPVFQDLVDKGADFPEPYRLAANIWSGLGAGKFSKQIVDVLRKAIAKFPEDAEFREDFQYSLFTHGKACWDREETRASFDSYLEGLENWRDDGNTISQDSPVHVRIGFLAARMFSKNAMESGDKDMAIRFFDFCESADLDVNLDLDVSDAGRA